MISVRGSLPPSEFFRGWKRIGRVFVTQTTGNVAIAAATTQTVASHGIVVTMKPGQGILVRRYVCGVNAFVAPNQIIYFAGSMELQAGAQPFTVNSGVISNDSEMLSGDPNPSVANAQTLSDVSITCQLRDDWFEYQDYNELGVGLSVGFGLGFMSFFRLRNADGAAAHNVVAADNLFYEVWEPRGLEGRLT